MAGDAFRARAVFSELLKELVTKHASNQAVAKVGNYAHKHREHAEVLYACIIDTMREDRNPFTCMTIFWVLDFICRGGEKQAAQNVYRDYMAHDLARVVDFIVPPQGGGRVNIPNARKALKGWQSKSLFAHDTLEGLLATLSEREASQQESYTKAEILKRIEEDRDRHKRNKEEIWCRLHLAEHASVVEFREKWGSAAETEAAAEEDEDAELTPLEWDAIREENAKYVRATGCDVSITPWMM